MQHEITGIEPRSVAQKNGLKAGDLLLSINGEAVMDEIDYQALIAGTRADLEILRNGQKQLIRIRKEEGEPLGLHFGDTMALSPRTCHNNCVFCFIAQMPPKLRKTLYVKDDDWRYSLMMGNFVTLTNVNDQEFDRIIRRKVSPLFISVHTTNPDLRVMMLRNPRAGEVMDKMQTLKEKGIRFHCQVVLCPGWNDGEELLRTLADLKTLRPAIESVALVPIGLTKYRDNLPYIKPYDKDMAAQLLDMIRPMQEAYLSELGTRFVFPSDEFYCLSGYTLPTDEEYEDYPQIENGVGMLRMFETDLQYAVEDLPAPDGPRQHVVIACGTSVAPFLQQMADEYAPDHITVTVQPIINRFFGETVTVSGLITGGDLVEQLQGVKADKICIVRSMIRAEGDLFLDDMTIDEVRQALPATLCIVENTGEGFWRAISGQEE